MTRCAAASNSRLGLLNAISAALACAQLRSSSPRRRTDLPESEFVASDKAGRPLLVFTSVDPVITPREAVWNRRPRLAVSAGSAPMALDVMHASGGFEDDICVRRRRRRPRSGGLRPHRDPTALCALQPYDRQRRRQGLGGHLHRRRRMAVGYGLLPRLRAARRIRRDIAKPRRWLSSRANEHPAEPERRRCRGILLSAVPATRSRPKLPHHPQLRGLSRQHRTYSGRVAV